MLDKLGNFLTKFNMYIIGGLLITVGVTGTGWYVTSLQKEACENGRIADRESYKRAQAEAETLHLAALRKKEKEYEDKANKADADYGKLAGKYADALRVYAAAQGKARYTIASPGGNGAASPNGPRENPFVSPRDIANPELDITEVVVVPINDLAICAENTARLVVARDWALGLNK